MRVPLALRKVSDGTLCPFCADHIEINQRPILKVGSSANGSSRLVLPRDIVSPDRPQRSQVGFDLTNLSRPR